MSLLFSSIFFFKQQTAYEMRISDWSSDVCSSDLTRSETLGATDMADIDSRIEAADKIGVTTGPIRGSRKVHVASPTGSGIRPEILVAMREIDLDPHSGEPSVRVYDTSGPSNIGRDSCRERV